MLTRLDRLMMDLRRPTGFGISIAAWRILTSIAAFVGDGLLRRSLMTSDVREPDALTAHVRIYEGATSIVHGSNIVTPPEETGGKQGKQTVS